MTRQVESTPWLMICIITAIIAGAGGIWYEANFKTPSRCAGLRAGDTMDHPSTGEALEVTFIKGGNAYASTRQDEMVIVPCSVVTGTKVSHDIIQEQ